MYTEDTDKVTYKKATRLEEKNQERGRKDRERERRLVKYAEVLCT